MEATDVLIVGAGPVGLQLALELQQRGIGWIAVDRRGNPEYYCKALGVTPRTQEIWEQCGVLDEAHRRGAFLAGIESAVDDGPVTREAVPVDDLPYGFLTLAQYDTEEILRAHLARHGGAVRHGVQLVAFVQDPDGVTAELVDAGGEKQSIRSRWVVGCDGAHSTVRKGLGIEYEGDAYAMTFMLGDVRLDWDRSPLFGHRITHLEDGALRNVLVCIPIPGDGRRYRVSLMAPLELQSDDADLSMAPSLDVLRAEAGPILPPGTTMSELRWSSYYRISHRIASRYASGRCFLAGDAAHIHPPIGGQGMNTGLQDAHGLAWRLALAAQGRATDELLDGYAEERRPVGLDVVQRTTRRMDREVASGDGTFDQWREDSQLFVGYCDSRWVAEDVLQPGALARGPRPGARAPDAAGLRAAWIGHPIRLADRLRHGGHLLVLWLDGEAHDDDLVRAGALVEDVARRYGDVIAADVVLAPDARELVQERPCFLRDAEGAFRKAYDAGSRCLYLIRPDRHVAYRGDHHDGPLLERYLRRIFRPTVG